jgi:RHS repeat-associated protein
MTCVTSAQTQGPCPSWSYSATTNQITNSGFSYDAAGNLTADGTGTGSHTYQWDAEGRWSGGNTYDALGQLVQNGATAFPYDAFGNQAAWYTVSNGVWFVMYVPFQGQILADAANDVFFHRNALGSVTFTTTGSGAYYEEYVYYPWGQIWANPAGRQYEQRFASMPFLDTVDPIFGTPFRTQEPRLGRWLSPDPLAGNVFNPQSLNRYVYVQNNPTTLVDPKGLLVSFGQYEGWLRNGGSLSPGGDWNVDGLTIGCGSVAQNGVAACPNNVCSGFGTNAKGPVFAQFYAFAGGVSGYFNPSDLTNGINEVNGGLLTDAGYQAYVLANFAEALIAQEDAAVAALENQKGVTDEQINQFLDVNDEYLSQITLEGGNFHFLNLVNPQDPGAGQIFNFGCDQKRCDEGALGTLDFSHGGGNTFHLDTADPYTDLGSAAVHFVVDVFGGSVLWTVIPRH